MARERQEAMIDGHRYEMTMLGATSGYRLFHRLFTMFGPSFGSLMNVVADGTSIQDVDLSSNVIVQGIQTLTANVKESDLDHVVDQLKGQTHVGVNGSEKTVPLGNVFEAHFAGSIGSMFKWLYWGLKVQYANFFDAFENLKPPSEGDGPQAANSQSQ